MYNPFICGNEVLKQTSLEVFLDYSAQSRTMVAHALQEEESTCIVNIIDQL